MSTAKNGSTSVARVVVTCAFCHGKGTVRNRTCQVCSGRGVRALPAPVAACPICRGTGVARGTSQLTCSSCGGVGSVAISKDGVTCPSCFGTGWNREHPDSPMPCARCRGKGVVAPTGA
jgi:DnaJ-class molecular chaperone